MANRNLRRGARPANTTPKTVPPGGIGADAGAGAGEPQAGEDDMNMHTSIKAAAAEQPTPTDPADFPNLYGVILEGDSLEPVFKQGTCFVFSKTAPCGKGDIVDVWFHPEAVTPYSADRGVFRLAMAMMPGIVFPFRSAPTSEVEPLVMLETLKPSRRAYFRASMILAMHKAVGTAQLNRSGVVYFNDGREDDIAFIDEEGNPSDRSGPDLTKAEPIEEVVRRLRYARNAFSVMYWRACRDSGIDLSAFYPRPDDENGANERIQMGMALDSQTELRRARYQALASILKKSDKRYADVLDLLHMLGRFVDNRWYDSMEEGARHFIAAGGRIMIRPDGEVEDMISASILSDWEDHGEGYYAARRVCQRFGMTKLRPGAKERLAELIRQHGKLHEGSGWLVWEGASK